MRIGIGCRGAVRAYLRAYGFRLALEDMEPHILAWERWMRAEGDFYDYRGYRWVRAAV